MAPGQSACYQHLRRTTKRFLGAVAVATLSTIVIAAPTLAASPKPTVRSFKVTPTSLIATGGSVTFTASVKNATSCTFSVTPSVKGLPATVPCKAGKASERATLPANGSAHVERYTFFIKASGSGGSTTAKPVITKVLAAPSISSFTPTPNTLTPAGGAVTLTASVKNATSCTFSVTPSVKGLPATVPCASNKAAKKVSLPENATASTATYAFSLKASGPGGSTMAKPLHAAVLPFWSAPQSIDPIGSGLTSVSCATASFCVAVDNSGNALTWNGSSWSTPQTIDSKGILGGGLATVSCPTTSFCQAFDGFGNAVTWNGSSWSTPQSIDPNGGGLTSVSCATVSFCVAVDFDGNAFTWNGQSWSTPQSIDPNGNLVSVSCPTRTYCAAVDNTFNVLTWNGSSWSTPQSIDRGGLTSISCATGSFCVAVDNLGNVVVWNGNAWSTPQTIDSNGDITSVSCPTSSYCSVVDHWGVAYDWNGQSWSASVTIDPEAVGNGPSSVSCPSASFCAVAEQSGNAIIGKS